MRGFLEVMSRTGLHLRPEKCEFHKEELKHLELIIGRVRVKMDIDKLTAVQDFSVYHSTFAVRSFIGFVNVYRSFIYNLSGIVFSLTTLSRKCVICG